MAISYKTTQYILHLQMVSLYNLELLYNKSSDLGIDYERGCQIFNDFDKCTIYIVHCTMYMELHVNILLKCKLLNARLS